MGFFCRRTGNLNRENSFSQEQNNKMRLLSIFKGKEGIPFIHKESQIHPLPEPQKELRSLKSQPLPLPCPLVGAVLTKGSFNTKRINGPLLTSIPLPLPPIARELHHYSLEEISVACQHFSFDRCMFRGASYVIYRASFTDHHTDLKMIEAIVTSLHFSSQGLREFLNQLNIVAALKHPSLCKVIGFHAREGSDRRMVVYEGLFHGSLDRILFGGSNFPSLDWNTRMKIALSTAKGLAFLHEAGPFQAIYSDFSSASIQVSKDFTAKLSGYGFASHCPETALKGLITPKSNVWSFGVVLIELLTGRKNSHTSCNKERDIVQWSKQFLADESRLSLIMDPRLQGRFSLNSLQIVAQVALSCLHRDPSKSPTIGVVVELIEKAYGIKYSSRCPLQVPSSVKGLKYCKPK